MTLVEAPRSRVKAFLRLVAIEHSVFALPFAYLSALNRSQRDDPHVVAVMGYLGALAGRPDEARGALRELEERARTADVPYVALHFLYVALDDRERLYRSLEEKIRTGVIPAVSIRYSPTFDRFRDDPEFQALMERAGA